MAVQIHVEAPMGSQGLAPVAVKPPTVWVWTHGSGVSWNFKTCCRNRFWPFSALVRPPPGPGRSQDVAMIHGYVLASPRPRGRPKKGRKRPKTISKKIQNFTENFQNPYFSFPRLWFPHLLAFLQVEVCLPLAFTCVSLASFAWGS